MRFELFRTVALVAALSAVTSVARADGADEAMPSFYEEAGVSRTRDYVNQHANEKIDPFTGKLQWHFVDLFIPGNGGFDLKVQRSYSAPFMPTFNSPPWEPTPAGFGWTIHFGRVLRNATTLICDNVNGPNVDPVLELPHGSRPILRLGPSQLEWFTTDLWRAECNLEVGGLNVFSPDGTKYEMTHLGHQVGTIRPHQTYYASRITDRNGNWMTISYTSAGVGGTTVVSGVTTSDGRTLTFSYLAGKLDTITDGARTWTYIYSAGLAAEYPYLREVRRPDGISWRYDYNEANTGSAGDFALQKVTYPQGGTIEYTFGFVQFAQHPDIPQSTVVTQKVASPGGTWTYAYEPATTPLTQQPDGSIIYTIPPQSPAEAAQSDKTTITGPEGRRTHYHIGYNSAVPGIVYLIGWQLGTASATNFPGSGFFDTQYTAFWPTGILISNRPNVRSGGGFVFDGTTLAPLLRRTVLNRNGQLYDTQLNDYDGFGNPQQIVESGTHTRTTALTYFTNPTKWIIHQKKDETVSEGTETLATTRTFDANGNMLTEDRSGVPTTFSYTGEGDIATRTDARSKVWSYLNYFRGIPQTENQPESVTITRVVSNSGNVTSETDGELSTTGYSYDGLNRLTGITHPLGAPVTVAWTATSRTVTRGDYRQLTTYDGISREIRVDSTDIARSETVSQVYRYDALGRRTFASYLNNLTVGTGYDYDVEGQLLNVFHEFNPDIGNPLIGRSYFYAANEVWVFNERGFQYNFRYRNYGNTSKRELIRVTPVDIPAATTDIVRNVAGQTTAVTQDGVTRSYGYDNRFFLTSTNEPETGLTTMGRDEVGNMTSRQVGGSGLTSFTYDDRNRNTVITYPAGTPSVTLTYFKDDKLKSSDNSFARCDYTYDANKNLRSDTLTIGTNVFATQYDYDGNDALSSLTYGSGRVVTYAPDAFGRPRSAAPYITNVTYHPTGQTSSVTYANGVTNAVGLNARQWPRTMQLTRAAVTFNNQTYGYDDMGNVATITDSAQSQYNRGMTYDALDRLTGLSGAVSGTIGYDGRGNITSQNITGLNLTYTYESATQRLQSVSGTRSYTFSYDAYGNVTNNGTTTFAYNDAPSLRCANCGLPNEILYDYDGKNQRVRVLKDGTETFFVHGQGGQLLSELTPNTRLKEYIYLGGKQVAVREQPLP